MKKQALALLGICGLWAMVYLPSLGVHDASRNECRRILPAVTMLESGDWSTPMLSGEPYLRKPPMMNWIIASIFKASGSRELSMARFATALAVLALAIAFPLLSSGLMDLKTSVLAAAGFITCFGMINLGRSADIDPNYVCATGFAALLWLAPWSRGETGWRLWLPASIPLAIGLLLKGPLIFLFHYALIGCVLHLEKRKRELLSPWHFLSIALAIAPFLAWSLFFLQSGHSVAISETDSGAATWYREIAIRFKFGEITFGKWLSRVTGSVAQFLPLIIVLPLLWSKTFLDRLKGKTFILAKAAGIAFTLVLILIDAMPATKARYSAPLIPMFAIATALISANLAMNVKWESMAKKFFGFIFAAAFAVSTVMLLAAVVLKTGVISLQSHSILKTALHSSSTRTMLLSCFVSGCAFILYWRMMAKSSGLPFLLASGALATAVCVNIFLGFLLPLTQARRHHAVETAEAINEFTPASAIVCGVGYVGEEPFIVHLKRKWVMIAEIDDLKTSPEVFILSSKRSDKLARYALKHSLEVADRETIVYDGDHVYQLIRLKPKATTP